jgi:hypothetical protein
MASLSPAPKLQFFGSDGLPLVGGKLYTYEAGTTTPLATYTDYTGTTQNTNPVILDSYGQANVWIPDTINYKYVLKTSADVTLYTVDYVSVPLTANSFASPPAIGSSVPNAGTFTTLTAIGQVTFASTGAAVINVGTTGERPASPQVGMIRYNTTVGKYEGYSSSAWGQLGGGATGGGTDQVFIQNGQTVTTDYTITTNYNAGTFGPVSVDSGITVTVPSGSVWSIV